MIRQNGQTRTCPISRGLTIHEIDSIINPLGIYNDETLKLDYPLKLKFGRNRSKRSTQTILKNATEQTIITRIRSESILQPGGLWPKMVQEKSGELVRVVEIVSY